MDTKRLKYQGITNILRFNWHYYALIAFAIGLFGIVYSLNLGSISTLSGIAALLAISFTLISLAVSTYIYDLSDLYKFSFIDQYQDVSNITIVNLHAGFDETSAILKSKFPDAQLHIFDFYDPAKHTEVSIKRARIAYPPDPTNIPIATGKIPLNDNQVDLALCIFALHEIRDNNERTAMLRELKRVLKPKTRLIIVEHLRDFNNLLAYTIGAFHFHSPSTWKANFDHADFTLKNHIKINPFVHAYMLEKNGNPS